MVPEATAALSTSVVAGRTSAELGAVARGPRRGQALLPVKHTSNPPPSFHLHQHPRPAQPISPVSFRPSLLQPCPSTLSPFSPQRDGLKTETRAKHSLSKNPSVASCCAWTKTRAPSVGSQWAPPNSSVSSPRLPLAQPHWSRFRSLNALNVPASQPFLVPGGLLPETTHGW